MHKLWETAIKSLSTMDKQTVQQVWKILDGTLRIASYLFIETMFPENMNTIGAIERVTAGFKICTIATECFPTSLISIPFTRSLLWQISFAITRDKQLKRDELTKKPKASTNRPYLLSLEENELLPLLKNAQACDELVCSEIHSNTCKANDS